MVIRLISKGVKLYEFKVDWNDLQYLCKDLTDIQPFNIPIIIFSFENIVKPSKDVKEDEQRRSTRKKRTKTFAYPIYLTTKEIWNQIEECLPYSTTDPAQIIAMNLRYYNRHGILNLDDQLNGKQFLRKYRYFTEL